MEFAHHVESKLKSEVECKGENTSIIRNYIPVVLEALCSAVRIVTGLMSIPFAFVSFGLVYFTAVVRNTPYLALVFMVLQEQIFSFIPEDKVCELGNKIRRSLGKTKMFGGSFI